MKKILYTVAILTGLMIVPGCTDMLKEKSKTEISKENYFNNASEADVVLQGVYRVMCDEGTYRYNISLSFPLTTDIAQCEGSGTTNFREVPANAHTVGNEMVLETWRALYRGIYRANDFIEMATLKKDQFSNSDRHLAEIYIAEARALRGLFYFELVRLYGNVILMKSTEESLLDPKQYVQARPQEVYEFIEADLLAAADVLPWSGEDEYRSNPSYRFSRGAALGLLAKVYATWAGYPVKDDSKWEAAAKTAAIVINSGKHSLLPNYADVWNNTCNGIWDPTESLIEVSFYSPTGIAGSDPVGRIGKWNGVTADMVSGERNKNAANVKVVYTFADEWRTKYPRDLRWQESIADYQWVGYVSQKLTNEQRWTPAKWDTERVKTGHLNLEHYSNINWYILRYSDVLLLYAEAINEWKGAPNAEAYAAVNRVRRRGFGVDQTAGSNNNNADLAAGMNQADFREAVRKERAYELCFEGHRKQDLIRWGIYFETVRETAINLWQWNTSANYVAVEYTQKGKHELYPIPQREMDFFDPNKVKQNPNW